MTAAPAGRDPDVAAFDAFDVFEREGWDAAAEAYEAFLSPVTDRIVDPLLDAVGVAAGDELLDVACGPGRLLASASARGAQAVGLDISPAMVQRARRSVPEVPVHRGDAQHLPFADRSFDAVTAAFVLMHVALPDRVVSEAARVVRRGGRFTTAVWDDPSRVRLIGWMLDAIAEAGATPPRDLPDGPAFFAYSPDAALVELLEGHGFGEVTVTTVELTHRAGSVEEVWKGLVEGTVRTAALLRSQDQATLDRVHEVFVALASPHVEAGEVQVPVSVKIGSGVRP